MNIKKVIPHCIARELSISSGQVVHHLSHWGLSACVEEWGVTRLSNMDPLRATALAIQPVALAVVGRYVFKHSDPPYGAENSHTAATPLDVLYVRIGLAVVIDETCPVACTHVSSPGHLKVVKKGFLPFFFAVM